MGDLPWFPSIIVQELQKRRKHKETPMMYDKNYIGLTK